MGFVAYEELRGAFADRALFCGLISAALGVIAVTVFVLPQWRSPGRHVADLAEQRELLRATLASIGDGVIATDAGGQITFMNPVAEKLTGWTSEEARGESLEAVFRIVNETTRNPVPNPAQRALREGRVVGLANHTILIAKDGTEWPLDDSAAPIRGTDGNVAGAVLVFREIGERKAAEAELARVTAESERRKRLYETALSNTPDLVYVFDLDHRFTYANEALLAMWGKTAEASIGRTCLELGYEPWHAAMHGREIEQVRLTKRPIRGEVPFTGTGGRRIYDYIFVPVIGADGEVEAIAGTTRDVSDRKKAEEQLRASEERYRTLFESMGEGFCVIEMIYDGGRPVDYRFLQVNRTFEAHTGFHDATGRTIRELVPQHDAHWFEIYGRVAATGEPARFVNEARAMGRWYDVYAYRAGDGTSNRVALLFSDVTERKRAEEQLRLSEEQRRLAIEGAELGVWHFDPESRDLTTDDRFRAIFGSVGERLEYAQAMALIHPDDKARVRAAAAAATREVDPEPYVIEYRVIHPDGSVRWVFGKGRPTYSASDRRLVSFDGTVADITARKQAEELLRASEEQFRTLVTSIDQGFCVVELMYADGQVTDYRIVEANPVFEQQTGLAKPVGRTIRELAPDIEERWFEIYGRVAATGDPIRFVEGSAALGRWFDVFASPAGGPGSNRVAVLFSDITARRGIEAERERWLREVEAERSRLAEVFRHAPSFMAVLSGPTHVFERANDRYLELIGGREVIGQPIRAALPEVEGQGYFEMLEGVLRSGEPYIGTGHRVQLRRAGRMEERVVDFVYQPIRNVEGDVTGVLVQGIDTTERKAAEDALREADRKKDDFIALLAHELRNPLAPIRNGLQVIRLAGHDEVSRAQTQKMMDRQLTHMVRLIDDLLDVSRIERHKMELRRSRVSLADIVNSAVETARPAIEESAHEFTITLPAQPVLLDADLTRLSQVFSNLLTNSAKYTERGGRIWLTAETSGGEVVVAVRDTGIGIPAEALANIFDMFSQVDRSIERSKGGLGIGLALVKGLVEMHGGTVSASSEGAGAGSTFTVTLPILENQLIFPEPLVSDVAVVPRSRRRVLVVDDNRDGAKSLSMMLGLLGDDVRSAHDGLEAVEQAEQFRPDVILMDVGMPRLNGLEATQRIREHSWGRAMTIIALTGWGQDVDRERTRQAGCDGHLVKPVEMTDLEKLLKELDVPGRFSDGTNGESD